MSPLPRLGRTPARGYLPAPFVVGVPRSGTTLLRLLLDAHSQLAIPPETHFLPKLFRAADGGEGSRERALALLTSHRRWPDFELDRDEVEALLPAGDAVGPGAAARAFYGAYAAKQGKPRWGEKTPQYVKTMAKIAANLPEARFVHLIRDGRDVALSLLDVSWGPSTVEEAAELWADLIGRARRRAPSLPHYVELRYEALIADPEAEVRRVCDFAELDFEPQMLEYHQSAGGRMSAVARDFQPGGDGPRITAEDRARQHALVSQPPKAGRAERWRTEMRAPDLERFERIAGPTLVELGYPTESV